MDKLRIVGGNPLVGEISISGAKNATLPLMAASLLTDEPLILTNVPNLADVHSMADLLGHLGATSHFTSQTHTLDLRVSQIQSFIAPYDLVRKMRASILVLGPLMARCHQASISLPGGCAIGPRPVDLHIAGLEAMGAKITLENGFIQASAPKGLQGCEYTFPKVSVTGTENLLMAATLARGTTYLHNSALEPEVTDLAHCLNAMGARISGLGTRTLVIEGVDRLKGTSHRVLPDRIETGTYAIAAVATHGEILLKDTDLNLLPTFIPVLQTVGADIESTENGFKVKRRPGPIKPTNIVTTPYPGFATDLQAQMMALLTLAKGTSLISETIFENRLMHVPELGRMGANIQVIKGDATIHGVDHLKGAEVMATDLRASVSLVIAALAAQGETFIRRVYHLDRGYETIEKKLAPCGAFIERLTDEAESLAS